MPITLRATMQLSGQSIERTSRLATVTSASPAPAVQAEARSEPAAGSTDKRMEAIALATAGVAVIACCGWLMERRQRLAGRPSAATVPPAEGPVAGLARPRRRRTDRSERVFRILGKKLLMKLLFLVRTFAGASAILAAIAIVVFWAIESTELGTGEPGLNMALTAVLLAGCSAFWLTGRLANIIHRSLFSRDHPKFAD